jgi:hypothetical protein
MNLRLFILFMASCGPSSAKDWYIAQSRLGSGSGIDAADAYALTFFNEREDWGSSDSQIAPGDTVHLVGKVTTALKFQASGLPGKITTLLFEPGAIMTAPAWPPPGAIAVENVNYVQVDGGTNGVIENTANGTNMANHSFTAGVYGQESSYLTVRNLTISNLYVRVAGDERKDLGEGIIDRYNGGSGFTHFVATHNTIHDAMIGVTIDYGPGCSSCEVSNNTIYNCNWGGNAGDHGASATLTGLVVRNNTFSQWRNWDDYAGNAFHHNGFYAWAESGGSLSDVRFYDNIVGPGYSSQSSGGLFVSGNVGGLMIYNNILYGATKGDCPSDGFIFVWIYKGTQTGAGIYNNTIVGTAQSGVGINVYGCNVSGTTTYDIKNNIICGCATGIARFSRGRSTMTADYNLGYDLSSGETYTDSSTSSAAFMSFGQWRSLGYDRHGIRANPKLSPSFMPAPDSPAKGSGTNLSDFFKTDRNGRERPTAMSIGAYEVAGLKPSTQVDIPVPSPK